MIEPELGTIVTRKRGVIKDKICGLDMDEGLHFAKHWTEPYRYKDE